MHWTIYSPLLSQLSGDCRQNAQFPRQTKTLSSQFLNCMIIDCLKYCPEVAQNMSDKDTESHLVTLVLTGAAALPFLLRGVSPW